MAVAAIAVAAVRATIAVASAAIALTAAVVTVAIAAMPRVALAATLSRFLRTRFRHRALGSLAGE